ncbi:MAG: hypothetical protein RLZ25_306 [Pseudomonadota bacterium]
MRIETAWGKDGAHNPLVFPEDPSIADGEKVAVKGTQKGYAHLMARADVKPRFSGIDGNERYKKPELWMNAQLPEAWKAVFEVGRLSFCKIFQHIKGFGRVAILFPIGDPDPDGLRIGLYIRSIHPGSPARPNAVAMDEGKMCHIQLIFNGSGHVDVPVT